MKSRLSEGVEMVPNPYDPLKRSDLTANEKMVLEFTGKCIHGGDESLIDLMVAPDYTQHTHGIGQGREGLRRFLKEIAWRRPHSEVWRPLQVFASGNFVILHKLLRLVVIVDIFRVNAAGQLAEHWDVVQTVPTPDYDPMRASEEDFTRFRALFGMPADA
jgi:predicted SnoaL-like aldol condensation-catalyzing enzyme